MPKKLMIEDRSIKPLQQYFLKNHYMSPNKIKYVLNRFLEGIYETNTMEVINNIDLAIQVYDLKNKMFDGGEDLCRYISLYDTKNFDIYEFIDNVHKGSKGILRKIKIYEDFISQLNKNDIYKNLDLGNLVEKVLYLWIKSECEYNSKTYSKNKYYSMFSDNNGQNKDYENGCDYAVLDKEVLLKYDAMLEYLKNYFVNKVYFEKKESVSINKLFYEIIPFVFTIVLMIIQKQMNNNLPIVLLWGEVKKIILDNIERIYGFEYNIEKRVKEIEPKCNEVILPSGVNNLISIDTISISKMISYKQLMLDNYNKDEIIIIEKTKCVFYDIFMVTMYKIYKILENYKEFKVKNPEKVEEEAKLIDMKYFYESEEKVVEQLKHISTYTITYEKYCAISSLKKKQI